jgi:hypothetical protein
MLCCDTAEIGHSKAAGAHNWTVLMHVVTLLKLSSCACQSLLRHHAVTDSALQPGTVAEHAVTDSALQPGTVAEHAVTDSALQPGTFAEDAVTDSALRPGTISQDVFLLD